MSSTGTQDIISIQSSELLFLEGELAGFGSRAYAFTIDFIIRVLLTICLYYLLFALPSFLGQTASTRQSFTVLSIIGLFFVAYPVIFENLWSGKTVGKYIVGIRVIKEDGSRVCLIDTLIRNILRIIDSLPFGYCLGMCSIYFDRQNRRLGDILAETIVVYDKSDYKNIETFLDKNSLDAPLREDVIIYGLEKLSMTEKNIITKYYSRMDSLKQQDQKKILDKLNLKIFRKLTIIGTDDLEIILYEVYKRL